MSDTPVTLTWIGSTADPGYSRAGSLSKPEGRTEIPTGSHPNFGGDPSLWNPEDMLAGALGNCLALTFLAIAAKARVDVRRLEGGVTATVATEDRVSRVSVLAFRPVITVAPGTDLDKVKELFHKAHKYCVIANSFNGQVILEPTVVAE